jgi:hypothetical protein
MNNQDQEVTMTMRTHQSRERFVKSFLMFLSLGSRYSLENCGREHSSLLGGPE